MLIVSFIGSNASAMECEYIGFDVDNLWLRNFHGDVNPTTSDHKDTEGSLLIKDATPDSTKEVTASVVIIESEFPSIGFWWKKSDKNGVFFNLSFYVDDKFIEEYNGGSDWDYLFFSEFDSGSNRKHGS